MDPHLRNIEDLAAKNRLRSAPAASRGGRPQEKLTEREAGFRIHLQGANATGTSSGQRQGPGPGPARSKAPVRADHAMVIPAAAAPEPRSGSKWGTAAPVYFANADGSRMRVIASPAVPSSKPAVRSTGGVPQLVITGQAVDAAPARIGGEAPTATARAHVGASIAATLEIESAVRSVAAAESASAASVSPVRVSVLGQPSQAKPSLTISGVCYVPCHESTLRA